ncbi:hypothetical protein ACE7GA_26335 [Roseomonas sp. CCTCC AB2023176]|uniref:hypothetical protein n=1 Tax=Roseomonas sp. CCTCC AB2023176 TaxID=3342640 RepID=UPI0035D61FA5
MVDFTRRQTPRSGGEKPPVGPVVRSADGRFRAAHSHEPKAAEPTPATDVARGIKVIDASGYKSHIVTVPLNPPDASVPVNLPYGIERVSVVKKGHRYRIPMKARGIEDLYTPGPIQTPEATYYQGFIPFSTEPALAAQPASPAPPVTVDGEIERRVLDFAAGRTHPIEYRTLGSTREERLAALTAMAGRIRD